MGSFSTMLNLQDVYKRQHVNGHGIRGPGFIAFFEKFHQQRMVPPGVLCQLFLVLSRQKRRRNRLVDERQQAHEELVVRGPHNGSMESPVSCSPVPARTDTLLYSCPLLQDLCALCRRGPAAGQTGCLWLKDGAELKQVAELPPHPAQTCLLYTSCNRRCGCNCNNNSNSNNSNSCNCCNRCNNG